MKDEKESKGPKGSTTNKVRKLQKQYNKILVDLFDQFAAESIEEALDKNEGSFGENIQSIVQAALDNLKGKVMEELGVGGDGAIGIAIGGPLGGITAGAIMDAGGSEEEISDEPEAESDETEEETSTIEDETEESSSDESEEKVEEKATFVPRRNDQQMISEAYSRMKQVPVKK